MRGALAREEGDPDAPQAPHPHRPPPHAGEGGFDHAAIDARTDLLYAAHTANDAVDVIDCASNVYLRSIPGLTGVAGVLVSERPALVFTSNRREDTAGIFGPGAEAKLVKVPVGVRPNGLAFDPGRGTLIAASIGDPARPGSHTLSVVDVAARALRAAVPVPGSTRWAIYDRLADAFFVQHDRPAAHRGAGRCRTPRESRGPTRCRPKARTASTSTPRPAASSAPTTTTSS